MMMDMASWHQMLSDRQITLVYSGPLWSEGIGGIAETLKKRLEFDKIPFSTSQEVFSVFVEQMNNMLMYSAEKERFEYTEDNYAESPKGTFVLGKKGKTYFIQTGNVMKSENTGIIKNKIDYLNTLDKSELRKYYREQLKCENNNPGSKGAGLGFIEIARRISSRIEYDFIQYSDELTFFTLYVTIGGDENV